MKYIDEEAIELILEKWENSGVYEDRLAEMMNDHPQVTGFLIQESTEILTEAEKDVMWFITTTLIEVLEDEVNMETVSEKGLMSQEEANWALYQENPKGVFYDRISPFFEDYPQEDLLAFIEDMTQVDEEGDMTKIGREVVFMTCKSLLDAMIGLKRSAN